MGQRKEIIRSYVSQGICVSTATRIASIKRSTYYYCSNGRPRGKRSSSHTLNSKGILVENNQLVNEIIEILSPEYHDYGYQVVTQLLRKRGYTINPKKVYRLMKENSLLHPRSIRAKTHAKLYANQTIPPLEGLFATVEADIKYIYIHEEKRNAYLITFLCTFCRHAPVWQLSYSMKTDQIILMVNSFICHPIVKENTSNQALKVKIRTDNGPQFIAKKLAEVLEDKGLEHEFIKPGTPQENGHIESFHSTVTRLVSNKNVFQNLSHARIIFQEFYEAYNNTRVMKSLLYYSPIEFISLWKSNIIGIKRDKNNKEIFFFKEKPHTLKMIGSSLEEFVGQNKIITFENQFLT